MQFSTRHYDYRVKMWTQTIDWDHPSPMINLVIRLVLVKKLNLNRIFSFIKLQVIFRRISIWFVWTLVDITINNETQSTDPLLWFSFIIGLHTTSSSQYVSFVRIAGTRINNWTLRSEQHAKILSITSNLQ